MGMDLRQVPLAYVYAKSSCPTGGGGLGHATPRKFFILGAFSCDVEHFVGIFKVCE